MLNDEVRREIFDRVGDTPIDKIDRDALPENVDPTDPGFETGLNALWEAWVTLTYGLYTFGFSHRTLCDSAGQMVAVHTEANERTAAGS